MLNISFQGGSSWLQHSSSTSFQNHSYPEDQEHEGDEGFFDSSFSIDDVFAWIADEVSGELVDLSGNEDESIDGIGCEDSHSSVRTLEQFEARYSTYWPRWDGGAIGR
jgi:hypothetical protein